MTLTTRLFVSNLPIDFNEHALKDAFSAYGNLTNFDIKCKPGVENNNKKFAFVTIAAPQFNVESCIKYFSNEDFYGTRLYVTRARESFLERLQREREQSQNKNLEKNEHEPYMKKIVSEQHNIHKRKFSNDNEFNDEIVIKKSKAKPSLETVQYTFNPKNSYEKQSNDVPNNTKIESNIKVNSLFLNDERKQNSDKKRLESMKKKRQEFNEKKNIIKNGLISIDNKANKKILFTDFEEEHISEENSTTNGHNDTRKKHKSALFDEGESDDEINFEVKNQFEGKRGQKVLDLQSRYKSDKRFVLDERFIEESGSEKEEETPGDQEEIDLNQADEKSKQLNILQDVLGVTIKAKTESTNKSKTKLGMLRFDPTQPEHAKFLVPVNTQEIPKKSKKKKSKENKDESVQKDVQLDTVVEKVEVSKEQFYNISDSLKDTMKQSTTFSLRSLFAKEDNNEQEDTTEENMNYIPLQIKKDGKVKNPLDPGEKNPFVYDSSESENEEDNNKDINAAQEVNENKTVWREKLFFSTTDHRLKDGLDFFGKPIEKEGQKERRELKCLMKKRIYNKERKNTMFQKKIGGRRKSMKKKFRRN